MRQARDRQSHSKKRIWISKFNPNISKFFQSQLSEYLVKIKCLNSKKTAKEGESPGARLQHSSAVEPPPAPTLGFLGIDRFRLTVSKI
jgi:hypothetical protein